MKRQFTAALAIAAAALPTLVRAVDTGGTGLDQTAAVAYSATGVPQDSLALIVGRIVNGLLGILGVVFLVLVIWAGVQLMTAGGNKDALDKARKTIAGAAIGLVVVMASYAISSQVIELVLNATT
jgi:hypothetical protein